MYLISNIPLERVTNYEKSTQILNRPPNVFLSLTHNRFPPETLVLKGFKLISPPPAPPSDAILWETLLAWNQKQNNLITQLRVKVGTILCLFKYFSSHRHSDVLCVLPSFWGRWQRAELWVGPWISTPGPKLPLQMFRIPSGWTRHNWRSRREDSGTMGKWSRKQVSALASLRLQPINASVNAKATAYVLMAHFIACLY